MTDGTTYPSLADQRTYHYFISYYWLVLSFGRAIKEGHGNTPCKSNGPLTEEALAEMQKEELPGIVQQSQGMHILLPGTTITTVILNIVVLYVEDAPPASPTE